jgi:predicted GNAT family N-acyltransferase
MNNQVVEKLNNLQLLDLAEFIVKENFNHHTTDVDSVNFQEDIESIYKEELEYSSNSEIFVTKDYSNSIIGSIRVLKWNEKDILPIQKLFGINPSVVAKDIDWSIKNIYHIGRFAVQKNTKDKGLFKRLMVSALEPVCSQKNSIAFAECDKKLLRIMYLLGIEASVIGKPINYLGSETIPVVLSYNSVINFYNNNKSTKSIKREMLPPLRSIGQHNNRTKVTSKHFYNS